MSFSSEAKNELCHVPLNRTCCARQRPTACFYTATRSTGGRSASSRRTTPLPSVCRSLFRRAFSLSFDHVPPEGAAGKRTFLITAPEKILSILEVFGQESAVSHHINYGVLETDCCKQRSFFRGRFS